MIIQRSLAKLNGTEKSTRLNNAQIMNDIECQAELKRATPCPLAISLSLSLDPVSRQLSFLNAGQTLGVFKVCLFMVFSCPLILSTMSAIKQHMYGINPKHLPHQSCSFCPQRERGRGQATSRWAPPSSRSRPGEQHRLSRAPPAPAAPETPAPVVAWPHSLILGSGTQISSRYRETFHPISNPADGCAWLVRLPLLFGGN